MNGSMAEPLARGIEAAAMLARPLHKANGKSCQIGVVARAASQQPSSQAARGSINQALKLSSSPCPTMFLPRSLCQLGVQSCSCRLAVADVPRGDHDMKSDFAKPAPHLLNAFSFSAASLFTCNDGDIQSQLISEQGAAQASQTAKKKTRK